MKIVRGLPAQACFMAWSAAVLCGCGFGVWFQDVILTSEVKDPKPIPPFTVPAKDPQARYVQFLALGDAGTGRSGQQDVAAGMGQKAAKEPVSFVLVLGDNFYPTGVSSVTDKQWKTKFEDMYSSASLQVPFYAVLGNHDYYSEPQAEVEYSRQSTRWRMPSRYYTFVQGVDDTTSVQFFCLDTTPLDSEKEEEAEEGQTVDSVDYRIQMKWLQEQLRDSKAQWKIALGHHALYSGGAHGNNKSLTALLEPLFVQYKVNLYLAGHDHHLELKKPVKGVEYIVSGAGGTHRSVTWQDNTVYAATNMGFTFFRLSASDLLVEFLDRNGTLSFAYVIKRA